MKIEKICPGVKLFTHKTDQFKNSVVSINIICPLDSNACRRALVINLLARTSKAYPTLTQMNRRLAGLYGAVISPSVKKIGEAQVLSLSLISLDDRFALEKESILKEGAELLLGCLFMPDITPEGFRRENTDREKRLLAEKIDSERDDKRIYSLSRMLEEMCCDEAYGLSRLGTKQELEDIDGRILMDTWKDMLFTSPIQINATGSFNEEELRQLFTERFSALARDEDKLTEVRTEFLTEAYDSKTVRESQRVNQGKLVMGYRAGMTYQEDNLGAIKLMTSIFGGGTFSKLFTNVREKMSLCYYCSARLTESKGIITVESGVEFDNTQKALDAIRKELEAVRQGDFTDEVLENAKLSLTDSYKSYTDSVMYIDAWATLQANSPVFRTPGDYSTMINAVSREEVIIAANMISEDTVFILEGEREAE